MDKRGRQDGVVVHRLFPFFVKFRFGCFVYTTKRKKKARVTGPRSEGAGWQAGGKCGGPEMREEGCGGSVFTDTRAQLWLCASAALALT